jgi:hypothetical protein
MLRQFVVEPINGKIEAFGKTVFSGLSNFCLVTLAGFVTLWFAYVGYKAIVEGEFSFPEMVHKLVLFSILAALLSANSFLFYNYIYGPIKDVTNTLVGHILSISPKINNQGIGTSLDAIDKLEWTFKELIEFVGKVYGKSNILVAATSTISVAVLTFVFLMSELVYALYVVGNIMKLSAIGAISPLLIVAFAFQKTRGHVIGALQYLLCSALTLIIASFCVGMLIFVLRKFQATLDLGSVSSQDVSNMLNALFILACLSVYFLMLAPGVASAISGARSDTALTGIAAAAMSGGLTFLSSKVGLGPIKFAGSTALNKLVGPSPRAATSSGAGMGVNYKSGVRS